MADVKIPYPEAGLAAFEALDTYHQQFLMAGSHPELAPATPLKVKTGVTLRQFEVVGFDADELLVPATWNADPALAIKPIGVVTQAVVGAGAVGNETTVPTWYSGCFNTEALVWHASFDTQIKKDLAFFGAPSPTQIIVRKRP